MKLNNDIQVTTVRVKHDMNDAYCGNCFCKLDNNRVCARCGFDNEYERMHRSVALPLSYSLRDKYLIGRVLGAGGFGITYLVYDVKRNTRYAIKEYFPVDICTRCDYEQVVPIQQANVYEKYKEAFFREGQVLHSLKDSSYVVNVDSFFRCNNTAYLVMEYIEGQNLHRYAQHFGGKIPYKQACIITLSLALALSEVHQKGILHRDITPYNVLIMPNNLIKLIDFGSARACFMQASKSTSIRITEGYAAIEQYFSKAKQGPWTDVYALACTFYRLISGFRPPSALERQVGDTVEPLDWIDPRINHDISNTIERAMAINRRKRYSDMQSFIGDFSASIGLDELEVKDNTISALLVVQNGPSSGHAISLIDGHAITLGKDKGESDLPACNEDVVSRKHCTITLHSHERYIQLEDHSRNGTFLSDGTRVLGKSIKIYKDTSFRLASSTTVFSLEILDNA